MYKLSALIQQNLVEQHRQGKCYCLLSVTASWNACPETEPQKIIVWKYYTWPVIKAILASKHQTLFIFSPVKKNSFNSLSLQTSLKLGVQMAKYE